ncbi:MAG: bestrophin family protein [Flavobacteriales bacterium]|nr:bestrophin family protein [Flavobacteriales bacterium]
MIIYESKEWSVLFKTIAKTYKESYNQQQLAKFVGIVAVYTTLITLFNMHWLNGKLTMDSMFFSMLGFVLSLFLVFRLNSAYDRWWEGRKQWGKLINDSRTLALHMHTHIPADDRKTRKFFVINLSNFAIALRWHLRNDMEEGRGHLIYRNARVSEELEKVKHVPNAIVSNMHIKVKELTDEGMMSEFDKMQIRTILQGLIDVLGACERIKKTPIPFSHSTFIKMFILIYIFILPFGLVPMFEYLTIPAVMVMAFAMMGIEVISEEIEDPFGMEANSLPTGAMADGIRESVYEILKVKSKFVSEGASETGVLH